ncbi:MAG: pentapeptide repeat-containing protein [Ktedonobacterales bacterium]
MSEQASQPQRPTTDDRDGWAAYWTVQGMPWRTEPEIGEERQKYLAERRAVKPDIEKGIYPFRDENGGIRLNRADVEWLLATHESGGLKGPINWEDVDSRGRLGLDLRGVDLSGDDLSGLPLARTIGGLSAEDGQGASDDLLALAAIQLKGANLFGCHLEGALLRRAQMQGALVRRTYLQEAVLGGTHLEGATIRGANLRGAFLSGVHLEGVETLTLRPPNQWIVEVRPLTRITKRAFPSRLPPANLRLSSFDEETIIRDFILGDENLGYAWLSDVNWGNVNVSDIAWGELKQCGEEYSARHKKTFEGALKTKERRLSDYSRAVKANRQLATMLRGQGLTENADYFTYHAQLCQRRLLRLQRHYLRYLGSLLLGLIAGYGYRPLRSVATYLAVVLGFGALYFALGGVGSHHALTWNEALVVSLTAFHGRGFFATAFQPGDPQAAVAAVEAVFGLLIEITFIATFTQRFFAR